MILKDVPRNSFWIGGMFSCLTSCFNALGEDISSVFVRGLWKELFLFTFNADKGGGAHDWTLFPTFSTACEICSTLGYSYKYEKELTWSKAWKRIMRTIKNKKPVMTRWKPPEPFYPWFVLVAGYNEAGEKVYLHCYKGAFYEYPIEKFKQGWERGAIFKLVKKKQKIDIKETVLQSLKLGIETMNKKEVSFPTDRKRGGTFKCGFTAYEELINYLEKDRDYSSLNIDSLKKIAGWGSCHEATCENTKRHYIADYLLYIAREFSSDKRRYLERASELYHSVEYLFDNFMIIHPGTAPWSRQGYSHLPSLASEDDNLRKQAVKDFPRDMKEAAGIVRKILSKEKEAIEEIEKAID
ncbi:MAG: hypothetical protein E3J87_09485 [Candidatus Cloacimonadota bacterium]|nr:MAG: hypothetical protein E3J87_09485 [Candidatus Cloacimonadota bacterium]